MKKINKKAFTLIELLAVIAILAIILLVAVPKILNAIDSSKESAFKNNAGMLFKAIDLKKAKDDTFDPTTLTKDNIDELLEIDNDNYESLTITEDENGEYVINLVGKNSWKDYSITGPRNNLVVHKGPIETPIEDPTESVPDTCFTRSINAGEVIIEDYDDSCSKNPKIPNTLDGFPVTTIGEYAFFDKVLESVSIPTSVTSIEEWAFYINQLTSVSIPTSVTSIGISAFNLNKLPDNQAFIYARDANGDEITSHLVSYGGIKKENVVIPTSVTNIEDWAFNDNQITSITISNNVTNIGEYAFSDNQLSRITIPNSITTIKRNAFGNNLLESVTLPDNLTTIETQAFVGNLLVSVVIPNSVTYIGHWAFYNSTLTSVTIPANVNSSQPDIPIISNSFDHYYRNVYSSAAGVYTAQNIDAVWAKQS